MSEIIIPINGKSVSEIESDGLFSEFTWDALMPTISQFVRLRPDEIIDGLIVSDENIRVKISRKKGRKSQLAIKKATE